MLNSERVNNAAAHLRSKYLLKNEILETIKQSTIEQAARQDNIEKIRLELISKTRDGEEEARLTQELTDYKDQILELEWEIQGLTNENTKFNKPRATSSGYSVRSDKPDEILENSFGSSLASLVNGIEEHKIDKDALIEENLKLQQHINELFNIRGSMSNQ